MVINPEYQLLGTVTDGMRRGLLRGVSLENNITEIMNTSPVVADLGATEASKQALMQEKGHRHIPVVDSFGILKDLTSLDTFKNVSKKENLVFLMAGGFGKRLRPFTESTPKPLLEVGDKPMLENILNMFIESGFEKFAISLHYKAEMIKNYFGDGSQWDVNIQYTEEHEPLGTAGAIGLLKENPSHPIIVMNGDILTKVNFENLLNFHEFHKSHATMCIREHQLQVPYGTVDVRENEVITIVEKPVFSFFVNAGIYVLDPSIVSLIKKNKLKDMPDLLNDIKDKGKNVSAFPIHEYWLDMGGISDFEKAQLDYKTLFK